ncbi:hypothetical protein AKO1_012320 [Acrasis kona]|uniref:Uncharacterized protein n=1 Tax=Acrasis kona TaxID=1008807 RepID=A0AAW2YX21_9EUKA
MKVLCIAFIALIGAVYSQNLGVPKSCPTQCKTFTPTRCKSLSTYCDESNGAFDFTKYLDIPSDGGYPSNLRNNTACRAFHDDVMCLYAVGSNLNISTCVNGQSMPICYDLCSYGMANCYEGYNPAICPSVMAQLSFGSAQGVTNCKRISTLSNIVAVSTPTPTPTPTSSSRKVHFDYLLIMSALLLTLIFI